MDYLVVCLTALLAAGLTLFSGFGLGTVLLPAFLVFFPDKTAVGATAVVHLLNNLFKLSLLGKHADRGTVLRFGLPAGLFSFAGAWILTRLSGFDPLHTWTLFDKERHVMAVNLVLGALIVVFALFELVPRLTRLEFDRRYVPLGGVLSGFFGGLSGHQGALRTAFLARLGLSKSVFIATGVGCAVIVDLVRLPVYALNRMGTLSAAEIPLLLAATTSAFLGSFVGTRLMHKVTLQAVQLVVGGCLLLFGVALAAGLA